MYYACGCVVFAGALVQVEATKRWWSSPRFRYTARPFSVQEVVSLRGTMPETHPSNIQVLYCCTAYRTRYIYQCCFTCTISVCVSGTMFGGTDC